MAELLNKNFMSVHYGEIALKGGNRKRFEKILIDNIRRQTGLNPIKLENRLVLENAGQDAKDVLRLTPGVDWIGKSFAVERNLNLLKEKIDELRKNSDIKLDVNRIDKNYEKDSQWIYEFLSKDRKKGAAKVRVEVFKDFFVISHDIESCIGGLPVGSAGRVISLFSAGIDSSAVPFELMKRGCSVDLLHVYAMPNTDEIIRSKVGDIVREISKINKVRLYAVPFSVFAIETADVGHGYDLVLFKRFLLKLAEKLAGRYGYKAIASGDSLSQVASQTLDNIKAVDRDISVPVFRPFITANKEEIIKKAKFYNTYGYSIKEYRDCCSIVSKKPATHVRTEKLERIEDDIELDSVVEKSIKSMSVFDVWNGSLDFVKPEIVV